jgi:hypothetical protein
VTNTTILLDSDINDTGPSYELTVDGQGLALGKGARDEWDPNLVGGRVMGTRPYNLVDVDLLWVEARHPVFPVRRAVVATWELFSTALLKIT